MKACPACGRLYPEDAGFCPVDGSALASATLVPVAPDPTDPRVGQLLCGRYQIRRVIADGGMGRVYEALDTHERRSAALKVLHPEVAHDEVQLARFKREFEVSKLLPHAHIVEVRDFQPTEDGSYVLVMELLYGEELRSTLKREGVLSPGRLVRMVSQVAEALDAAHALKLVHRDLKPDNIFLCQASDGDTIKILDFGSVRDNTESAKKLTVMGTTIGSPYYMAPEQAQGLDTLDHRADVWALAAIVYEALTGQVPFNGPSGPSILLQILTKEPVLPSQVAKTPIPSSVDRVISNGLKKMPALRIASVGALADALGQAYGLSGSRKDWVQASEQALNQQIEAQLPALLSQGLVAPQAGSADSFFGESDALGATSLRPGPGLGSSPAPAPGRALFPSGELDSELSVAGLPTRGGGWKVVVVVGLAAILAGIGLVWWLL